MCPEEGHGGSVDTESNESGVQTEVVEKPGQSFSYIPLYVSGKLFKSSNYVQIGYLGGKAD